MKAKKETMEERAKRIADGCKNAYSYENYTEKGWRGCALLLVEAGCADAEVEDILRSKVMRWAADASDKPYGKKGADTLRAYFGGKDILAEVRKEIASCGDTRVRALNRQRSICSKLTPGPWVAARWAWVEYGEKEFRYGLHQDRLVNINAKDAGRICIARGPIGRIDTDSKAIVGEGMSDDDAGGIVVENPADLSAILAVPEMVEAIRATLAVWAPCAEDPNHAEQAKAQQKLVDALKKAGVEL